MVSIDKPTIAWLVYIINILIFKILGDAQMLKINFFNKEYGVLKSQNYERIDKVRIIV